MSFFFQILQRKTRLGMRSHNRDPSGILSTPATLTSSTLFTKPLTSTSEATFVLFGIKLIFPQVEGALVQPPIFCPSFLAGLERAAATLTFYAAALTASGTVPLKG